ncbi:hypothetical protein Mithridates_00051 [Acinetobacter phage Mithridates]|nr:hypothetical protein Mithridates_00051 [Acinetobacter phage Mithridates]
MVKCQFCGRSIKEHEIYCPIISKGVPK